MRNPQAIIFDFDGTIVDTETPEYQSWCALFEKYGAHLALSEWSKCVGAGPGVWSVTEHFRSLVPNASMDKVLVERLQQFEALTKVMKPLPGVMEWVEELEERGIPFGIASSSEFGWVDHHLDRLGIRDRFSVIVTRDQVAHPKPAPDLYLEACRKLNCDPAQCVAFEDSSNGVKSAKAAGMYAVAIPNPVTCEFDFSMVDLRLTSLSELTWDGLCEAFSLGLQDSFSAAARLDS